MHVARCAECLLYSDLCKSGVAHAAPCAECGCHVRLVAVVAKKVSSALLATSCDNTPAVAVACSNVKVHFSTVSEPIGLKTHYLIQPVCNWS